VVQDEEWRGGGSRRTERRGVQCMQARQRGSEGGCRKIPVQRKSAEEGESEWRKRQNTERRVQEVEIRHKRAGAGVCLIVA